MKRILLLTAVLIAAVSVYAQTTQVDSSQRNVKTKFINNAEFKPGSGNVSTELNVNPFNGELSLNNSLNQIKFRYFSKPNFAWRVGLSANVKDSLFDSKYPYSANTTGTNLEVSRKSTTLGLNIGFEKHFKGTKRLSPFMGAELSLSNRSSKEETTQGQMVTTTKGGWRDYYYIPVYIQSLGTYQYQYTQLEISEQAFFKYGVNLVMGFDFYMAKSFFFGYEFNFGVNKTNYKDLDTTTTGGTSTSQTSSNSTADVKNTNLLIGTNLINGIRIGYIF